MSSKSDYFENWVLDRLGSNTFAPTVYIALYTAAPTDAGGGTEVPQGQGSYARIAVPNTQVNWPNAIAGRKQNGVEISGSAVGGDWGTIVAMAIFDAVQAGNMLWWSPIVPGVIVEDGGTITFPVAGITINED